MSARQGTVATMREFSEVGNGSGVTQDVAAQYLLPRTLYDALAELTTAADCRAFLEDLCAPSELTAFEHRWAAACLIERGKTYREIIERAGISSAIVSRVKRVLQGENSPLANAARRTGG